MSCWTQKGVIFLLKDMFFGFFFFILKMTCNTHLTGGVRAQQEEVATIIMASQVPEANVRGDMIPQTPKNHGKNHCFVQHRV